MILVSDDLPSVINLRCSATPEVHREVAAGASPDAPTHHTPTLTPPTPLHPTTYHDTPYHSFSLPDASKSVVFIGT